MRPTFAWWKSWLSRHERGGVRFAALQAEPEIGVLLPCNVIVYESDDGKVRRGGLFRALGAGETQRP